MKSTGNEDTSIPPKSSSAEKDTASDATPKQSLLYKGHDTVIKTTGIDNSDIAFYFENNSDLNLSFDIHSYAVNGIMAEEDRFVMSTDVVSGKKASNTLSISKSWLRENGISEIKYVDILFWAYDNAKSYKAFESKIVRISANVDKLQSSYEGGDELYNKNGIVVDLLRTGKTSATFAVTNNTDSYFDFDVDNVSVNDWTYDTGISIYDEQVLPACTGIYTIEIDSDFKETNQISDINTVEFCLNVRPTGDYHNDYETEIITIQK